MDEGLWEIDVGGLKQGIQGRKKGLWYEY